MHSQPQPQPLQQKLPIKSPHKVHSLHILSNTEILLISHTSIQIHSTQKINSFLPSLIYIIQLNELVAGIDVQSYEDRLSGEIRGVGRNGFGKVLFGEGLDTGRNRMLDGECFKGRLRFMGGEFLRVREVGIHPLGHLLICFQDRRCILLKRNSPLTLSQSPQNLYNLSQPISLNKLLSSQIYACSFAQTQQLNLICFHQSSKSSPDPTLTLSRIEQKTNRVYSIPQSKRVNIESKGLIKMITFGCDFGAGGNFVVFVYFNRIQIVEMGKFVGKARSFVIFSHKEAEFSQELESEYIVNAWEYSFFSKNQRQLKIYLLTSASIWELEINFKTEPKDNIPWNYSLKKKSEPTTKSLVYFINFQGQFFQHVQQIGMQPNYMANFVAESENGLMVRLGASESNYQEGFMYLACPSPSYVLQKVIYNIKAKQKGEKLWLNFNDIGWLKKHPTLKKQLLKCIQELKNRQKQHPELPNPLLQILQLNVYSALESHPEKTKELALERIKQKHKQNFNLRHCAFSNKKITTEDILFCERCQLYSIKDCVPDLCCYICWNALYGVQ